MCPFSLFRIGGLAMAMVMVMVLGAAVVRAADHDLMDEAPIHFTHPVFTESPTPDTKTRWDYQFINRAGDEKADEHVLVFGGEYAFNPNFSVEFELPYSFLNPEDESTRDRFGNAAVALKFADYRYASKGWVLGGGVEFGLPTGNEEKEIGDDHVIEVEPFIQAGLKREDWELVAHVGMGFLGHTHGDDVANWELGWNVSAMKHLSADLAVLLEMFGENVEGGSEDGHSEVNLGPGVIWNPSGDRHLGIGLGVAFPLTGDRERDFQLTLSVFHHHH